MSGIPSDIAGSAAQAGYQQADAARARDSERAGQADAARDRSRAVSEAADTVETDDADARVHADAEGTGGQGRHFEGEEEAVSSEAADTSVDDATDDGESGTSLDVQA